MEGLVTEDLNSSGTTEDQIFQSLINITEERLKGKLSLLRDPEMSDLEAEQTKETDEDEHSDTANYKRVRSSSPKSMVFDRDRQLGVYSSDCSQSEDDQNKMPEPVGVMKRLDDSDGSNKNKDRMHKDGKEQLGVYDNNDCTQRENDQNEKTESVGSIEGSNESDGLNKNKDSERMHEDKNAGVSEMLKDSNGPNKRNESDVFNTNKNSDAIGMSQDSVGSNKSKDTVNLNKDLDGLIGIKTLDVSERRQDPDEIDGDRLASPVEGSSQGVNSSPDVYSGDRLIKDATENMSDNLTRDAAVDESAMQEDIGDMDTQESSFTEDKVWSMEQERRGKILDTMGPTVTNATQNELNSDILASRKELNTSCDKQPPLRTVSNNLGEICDNKSTVNTESDCGPKDTAGTNAKISEIDKVSSADCSQGVIQGYSVAADWNDEVEDHDNASEEYKDKNNVCDDSLVGSNLENITDVDRLANKDFMDRELVLQKVTESIDSQHSEPLSDENISSTSSTITGNDSQLLVEDTSEHNELQGRSEGNQDDTLPCLTIVSVRGAVDMEVEKAAEPNDVNSGTTTAMNDLTGASQPVKNAEQIHADKTAENVSQDPELRVHDRDSVASPSVTPISEMDTTDPKSFMISDVRSLTESDVNATEINKSSKEMASTTLTGDLNAVDGYSNQTEAANKKPISTSKSIDALQDMCSSVSINGSKNINKDGHFKSATSTTTSENVSTNQVILTTHSLHSEQPSATFPVISNVFSIKLEPKDDYGEYSLAEGSAQIQTSMGGELDHQRKRVVPVTNSLKTKTATIGVTQKINQKVPSGRGSGVPSSQQSTKRIAPKPLVLQILNTSSADKNMSTTIQLLQSKTQSTRLLTVPSGGMSKTTTTGVGPHKKQTRILQSMSPDGSIINDTFDATKMDLISIKTVGVEKITELIARKNPIPTYKPPPIPDELKSVLKVNLQYPCYECGDSFVLKRSLHNHISRRSMKIKYKCETCTCFMNFTNKCQMLSHLRGHLNINKTQAVPIHIKSDSIEISTYFDELCLLARKKEEFRFFDYYPEDIEVEHNGENVSDKHCMFCNTEFKSTSERQSHFSIDIEPKTNIFCDMCPMFMTNACGIKAHTLIHKLILGKSPKILVCPECGEQFPYRNREIFFSHIKEQCFHLSRYIFFTCNKCEFNCTSLQAMEGHLLSNLDIYYKCERCPMALRSVKNFNTHFNLKHASDAVQEEPHRLIATHAKIIYRCHHCNTLIDDRGFLEAHIQRHLNDIRASGGCRFNCIQCGITFQKKAHLKNHYTKAMHNKNIRRHSYCPYCRIDIGNSIDYVSHILKIHLSSQDDNNVKFCDDCGLVCVGEHVLLTHLCLSKSKGPGKNTSINKGTDNKRSTGQVSASKGTDNKRSSTSQVSASKGTDNKRSSTGQVSASKGTDNKRSSTGQVSASKGTDNKRSSTSQVSASKDPSQRKILPKPNQTLYDCKTCGDGFGSAGGLANHFKEHRENKSFVCATCGDDSFKTYNDVRSHEILCRAIEEGKKQGRPLVKLKTKKKVSPTKIKITRSENDEFSVKLVPASKGEVLPDQMEYNCDQCEAVFTRKTKLEEHKKSDHGLHPCHLCGLMHDSQLALKKHLVLSHEGKKLRYSCFICKGRKVDKYFTDKVKLEKHLRQKHRLKHYDDSKIVPELPGLEGKGISPEPEKRKLETDPESAEENPVKKAKLGNECTLKCAKCLFTSEVREEFLVHIKEHNDPLSVQCLECGLCFAVLPSLRKHLFMVHKVRNFDAYCSTNKIEEPKETEIERFTGNDPDVNVQDVGVSSEESDEEEEQSDANPLECRVCYKEFDTEAGLKSHMRVHGMALIKKLRRKSGSTHSTSLPTVLLTRLSDSCLKSVSEGAETTKEEEKDEETNMEVSETDPEIYKDVDVPEINNDVQHD